MIDFEQEWYRQMQADQAQGTPEHWDARARKNPRVFGPGTSYALQFLDCAQLHDGETIMDMGCGAGSLAIPAAKRGHQVLACDFSPRMLENLDGYLPDSLRPMVQTKLLAWEDDWTAAGIAPKSVDVAVSSRSLATADLGAALTKLTTVARRKVCMTISPGPLPRVFSALFDDLGLAVPTTQRAALLLGALLARGHHPEVCFIRTSSVERFASRDEAFETYCGMFDSASASLSGRDRTLLEHDLRCWLETHLVHDDELTGEDATGVLTAGKRRYRVDVPRRFDWMFVAWETGA